ALTRRTALRAQLGLATAVTAGAARTTGAAGAAGATVALGAAGRREAVTAGSGRRRRGRRHGTRHAVTADLAPVVGTRLVSVRAGRHVGASPSPSRPHPTGRLQPQGGQALHLQVRTCTFGCLQVTSLHERSWWTESRASSRRPPRPSPSVAQYRSRRPPRPQPSQAVSQYPRCRTRSPTEPHGPVWPLLRRNRPLCADQVPAG